MDKYFVTREKGIVWFQINRPEKRNAIDYDVMDGLLETIESMENSLTDKLLVISGTGDKSFCSGGDLSVFGDLISVEQSYQMLSKMGAILYRLLTLSKPSVALVNGIAIGGGCELATACDFRLATTNSKVGFVQGKLGITTGWGAGSILFEKIGYEKALGMLLSTDIYNAEEALQLGFIHKIISLENKKVEIESYFSSILQQNTNVIQSYKKILIRKWDSLHIKERMFEEIQQCSKLWATEEHHEAVRAFLNKA